MSLNLRMSRIGQWAQNSALIEVMAAAYKPADHLLQASLGDSIMDVWVPGIPGLGCRGHTRTYRCRRNGVRSTTRAYHPSPWHMSRTDLCPASTLVPKPLNATWVQAAGLRWRGPLHIRRAFTPPSRQKRAMITRFGRSISPIWTDLTEIQWRYVLRNASRRMIQVNARCAGLRITARKPRSAHSSVKFLRI